MKIIFDTPIEVSKTQYDVLSQYFRGIICRREENGHYFIKVWVMEYKKEVIDVLTNPKFK